MSWRSSVRQFGTTMSSSPDASGWTMRKRPSFETSCARLVRGVERHALEIEIDLGDPIEHDVATVG